MKTAKTSFFEKLNKIDKTLVRITKKKREKIGITNVEMEKRPSPTEYHGHQRILCTTL
jgi:argonaute-like protein implicated in RNA metabolism and viral defense